MIENVLSGPDPSVSYGRNISWSDFFRYNNNILYNSVISVEV